VVTVLQCRMPYFWLTYGDANRAIGAIIIEAPSMLQARTDAAVSGLDGGAPFAEGHPLSAKLMASVPPAKIGQMLDNDDPPFRPPAAHNKKISEPIGTGHRATNCLRVRASAPLCPPKAPHPKALADPAGAFL
jgi:hypothetical protein